MAYFLVQINGSAGYPYVTQNHRYANDAWMKKPRDKAHGSVLPGDALLFYCTGDVPTVGMTLAFSAPVEQVSPDHVTFELGNIRWFPQPLQREQILHLIDQEVLDDAFRGCGVQGFNISMVNTANAERVLQLVEGKAADIAVPVTRPPIGSPLDKAIERHLEDWLVEHWGEVDFGLKLQLYEENEEVVGQQYDTGEVGIIDLLCVDEATGDLVVIELKRGRPSDEVVGQLARYMGWKKLNLRTDGE